MIEDRNHHNALAWLFRMARRGQLPEALAHLFADSGLERDELEVIGAALATWVGAWNSHLRINRLAVQQSEWLGLRGRATDDPRRQALVADLFDLASRRQRAETSPSDNQRQWRAAGYLMAFAELALAADLPLNREALIDSALARLCSHKGYFSRTDVARAFYDITRFGPITDWIVGPEEAQRNACHHRLLRTLQGPGALTWLRGLVIVPEVAHWLCDQMRTRAERALLRALYVKLKAPKPEKPHKEPPRR